MRKSVLVVCCTAITFVLTGCGANVSQPRQSAAHEAVNTLAYAQDLRTGLCYAVISGRSVAHGHYQGTTITRVPCEPKVLAQIK